MSPTQDVSFLVPQTLERTGGRDYDVGDQEFRAKGSVPLTRRLPLVSFSGAKIRETTSGGDSSSFSWVFLILEPKSFLYVPSEFFE